MAEFQAIILAGGRGIRLYPLTDETPKALLPVNGKPLLWYQLYLLESSGFTDVIVVTIHDLLAPIQDFITRAYDGKLHIELCEVEDNTETADALREIADKIKRDFIVLAGDLVTDVVVHNVADAHRIQEATVTMVLKQHDRVKGEKPRREKDLTDCIALSGHEHRVVMLEQAIHVNEDLYIPKTLTKRVSNFTMHTDLYDAHFYIFSHWVIDLLLENKYIASIKADLLPHLVRRQFRGLKALPETVRDKAMNPQQLASSLSLATSSFDPEDVLRCFACVLPANAYCERADTVKAYEAMDTEVKSRLRITSRTTSSSMSA